MTSFQLVQLSLLLLELELTALVTASQLINSADIDGKPLSSTFDMLYGVWLILPLPMYIRAVIATA